VSRSRKHVLGVAAAVALVLGGLAALPVAAGPTAGGLDPAFGSGGIRRDDFGSNEVARGVALQPDGRIVVAGTGCGADILVARYTSGGFPDPSFTGDGWTCVDVGAGSADQGEEVFVVGDGKLLVAGTSAGNFALVRLNADGSPDPTFDGDGRATYDFGANERLNDAALAPGGKVVLAGTSEHPGCFGIGPGTEVDAALARVDVATGALDPGFGNGGRVLLENDQVIRARAVVVQPDGAVVVGGDTATCSRVTIAYFLRRLTAAGQPDPTFSHPPFFLNPSTVTDLVLQPDGKVVAVVDSSQGPAVSPERDDAFYVVRTNPNGSPDPAFDGDGLAVALFGRFTTAAPSAVVLQLDGKIVVGGSSTPASGGPGNFALARFHANGSPDSTTFGAGGLVVTDLGADDLLFALTLQPDTKVVAAGTSGGNLALARYLLGTADAPPPPACLGRLPATIVGTSGSDTLTGTPGTDVIVGLGGDDTIDGLGGDDRICGGDGNDVLIGGDGKDRVGGEGGNDRVLGAGDDDRVLGGDGGDFLRGDAGNDTLLGESGDDRLLGAGGNDTLQGNDGSDTLNGGRDVDVVNGGPEDDPPADVDTCEAVIGTGEVFSNCEVTT
jgi:uncharacterized delta-60 repeat protein